MLLANNCIRVNVTQGDLKGKHLFSSRYASPTTQKEPHKGEGQLENINWAMKFVSQVWN